MLKKIHSNRDPRDTVFSELRKEFSAYFGVVGVVLRSFLGRYPKFFFVLMVVLMTVSLTLSFTVFRHPKNVVVPKAIPVIGNPVSTGFSQIMQATEKIKSTLRLKHLVDSISAKKQLTPNDSTLLDSALSQLQRTH